jgi:site-specific DNA recombinase
LIRRIIQNPVYCGKIAYGRRRTEKVHGTRNDYHLVEKDDYILVDGRHEGIISEDDWQAAQVKVEAQAKKYEHVNRGKNERIHLLTGIVKCPLCGAGMYGNKSTKHRDGKKYKDYYFYGCKHRLSNRGHKCDYHKQISEEVLDNAVAEVITQLVRKPKFAALMQSKIDMKVDTATIDQEITNYEKELRHFYSLKNKLLEEIDGLDFDDKHYTRRKSDLEDRLSKAYDRIDELEELLLDAKAKKRTIEAEKITGDNIYKILFYFDKMYAVMDEAERRHLMDSLIDEIQIYEERQPNGQWLKSIRFKLPIIDEDMSLSLDNDSHIETVVQLSKGNISSQNVRVEFSLEDMDMSRFQQGATYEQIQEWVQDKYGFHVTHLNIAQVKRDHGIIERENYNKPKSHDSRQPGCPEEKVKAIEEALKQFQMI